MKQKGQDIYESQASAKRKKIEKESAITSVPVRQDDLVAAIRRYRRSFFLFWLVLFLFTTTLGWLVVDRHLKLQSLIAQQQRTLPPPCGHDLPRRNGHRP